MLRVNQVKVRPGEGEREILQKTARILRLETREIARLEILRCSIDARKKPEIWCSYTVDVELKKPFLEPGICKRLGQAQVSRATRQIYHFPESGDRQLSHPPVIVGMGPAGLFCAYYLALHGYRPIVLERGEDVDRRTEDVQRFWESGILQPQSNVQFGEGGAGTFSDGKLNTLVKDKYGRNREVLKTLVAHGAPERILYDAKPHMGTDVLSQVVKSMRQAILAHGGQVLFGTMLEKVELGEKGNQVTAACTSGRRIPCGQLVLAIGHSARDTFQMLLKAGLPMEAKPFAVGMRIEHPQSMINKAQYGKEEPGSLGAAPYKLTAKASNGRGVYSFCMCPGGYVVNASSEPGRLAVNGMSYSGRNGSNANSAIIVSVTPEDYSGNPQAEPLAGVEFQRRLEEKAYELGGGAVPVQRYGQYKACVEQGSSREEQTAGQLQEELLQPCIKGKWKESDLSGLLPEELGRAFVEGMEQ
ncbi:MAG: FAD-dependent oxidoreductase, partial [Acetatifactor sp.]|nr:FAD-dependent oxidoreductase [Acetatifactor sp.]